MLRLSDVKKRAEGIVASLGSVQLHEIHQAVDDLFEEVLSAISFSACEDPRACAEEALKCFDHIRTRRKTFAWFGR